MDGEGLESSEPLGEKCLIQRMCLWTKAWGLTVFYHIFHIYILMVSKVIPTDHRTLLRYRRVNCAERRAYRWHWAHKRERTSRALIQQSLPNSLKYLKGTVHPKIKNTCFYSSNLWSYLSIWNVSVWVADFRRCLTSRSYCGTRWPLSLWFSNPRKYLFDDINSKVSNHGEEAS